MKRHQPRLWPLMKRFGWLGGWRRWQECRAMGCHWELIPGREVVLACGWAPNGEWHCLALLRARCAVCESVKLFRATIVATPGGQVSIWSPGTRINVITKQKKDEQ